MTANTIHTAKNQVYLASQSPRRAELLRQIGVGFSVRPAEIDETPMPGEVAADYVARLALAKADHVARQLDPSDAPWPVLAADTAVVVDGEILGKPRDRTEGVGMLGRLSGRGHQVMTAVALIDPRQPSTAAAQLRVVTTEVAFRPLTRDEIDRYWQSGEPADKAGGYAIQGFAAVFVQSIRGSYSAVVGLPLLETYQLLEQSAQL